MVKRKVSCEEIIHRLREADVLIGQGKTILGAAKQLGITDQTYFRWRKSYGGLKVDQASARGSWRPSTPASSGRWPS